MSSGQHQIGHAEERQQLGSVLRQTPVPNLPVPEQILHHMKRMLHLGTDAGLQEFGLFKLLTPFGLGQRHALAGPHGDVPLHGHPLRLIPFLNALVARIAKHRRLVPVQQVLYRSQVMNVARRAHHTVGEARFSVHANMRLHAEVPLVAFLRLMHFGVPFSTAVLGGGRGGDQGGVHNGALTQKQAAFGQMRIEGAEDDVGQLMGLQQTAELEDSGGIRCGLACQVDADKAADGLAVVKGIFDAFIRKPEAVLGDVHPQHAL